MRPLILFALALPLPALAADIDAASLVTAATLYPSGATVTRTVRFSSPAGENRIVIDDLPLDFLAGSLRVDGAGDGPFTILSVDHRVDRLPPPPDADTPERKRIEAEIEALEERLRGLDFDMTQIRAEIAAADARLKMIDLLMSREPQKMVDDVEYQRAGAETWAQVITLLATETQAALSAHNDAARRVGALDRTAGDVREELEKKRAELEASQLPAPPRSIATVELTSAAPLSGTLDISYRVWQAGWQPVYDLRLDQGDQPMLAVERHARVFQETGEDWRDAAITLSTARPSERMDAPDLPAQRAYLYEPYLEDRPDAYRTLSKAVSPAVSDDLNAAQMEMLVEDAAPEPQMEPASMQTAMLETLGQTVVYRLAGDADVAGDGTVRQLAIDARSLPVEVLARSTPEFDTNAYLYASLENGFGAPLLPGQAAVFRDGTFVGEISVPLIAAGKTAVLPFGVLDELEVTRHVLEKEDGDFGIIGTTNQRIERYDMTAKSTLPYPIVVTLYDRVPYTEEKDLTVAVTSRPDPSVANLDGKRGVNAWTFELAPGAERTIAVGVDIRWPGDKAMALE